MRRMILLLLVLSTAALSAAPAWGESPYERATKLYKMNRYEQAVRFRYYLSSVSPEKKGSAFLSLGVFFLADARLHRELHETSVSVNMDYLSKIAGIKGKDRSRVVNLYMAETLLEAGRPKDAAFYFVKVLKDKRTGEQQKAFAKAGLGLAFHLQGKRQKADSTWGELKGASDAEVTAELAAAYNRAGLKDRDPVGMCGKALASVGKSGGKPSVRMLKNAIGVYASAGKVEKALDLLKGADLMAFSHEEVLGENKVIRFYDPALLGNLSRLYARAGLVYLGKALESPEVKGLAQFYTGEAYSLLGMVDESMSAMKAAANAPARYRAMAEARQASNLYLKGKKKEAEARWETLSKEHDRDPYMLAEILMECNGSGAGCTGAVKRGTALAEAGEGSRFSRLNHALGRYYLVRKDYAKALSYMEAGRDKGNKNRIEHNDPAMLVHIAQAYYHTKNFSEALEIFFEMSRQFPEVRQIQVSMQGVYSIEQKSAGDVKVF